MLASRDMAKKNIPTPAARAARDALLARARWIIDSNIRAACGHRPQLPPDLVDFNDLPGLPNPQALQGLLRSVMPAINLEDDRIKTPGNELNSLQEQGHALIMAMHTGAMSTAEAHPRLRIVHDQMEANDREKLMDFLRAHKAK